MLVEEALQKILRTNAGVSAIVSDRIYPGFLPQQDAYPAIVFVAELEEYATRLESRGAAGLARYRLRVASLCKGPDQYGSTAQLDQSVRLCLQGYRGTVDDGGSPPLTIDICGILLIRNRKSYDDPTQVHQIATDYEVWAEEQQPTP